MLLGILVIPYAVEIVTAITIIIIGAILAIYLSILKRNGWIGKPSNYRCPNPKCKKIFQTPLKVKDFSNKNETHLACPECGYDLGSSKNEKSLKEITLESKPEPKTKDSAPKPIEPKTSTTNNGITEPKPIKTAPPIVELKENRTPKQINKNSSSKQKLDAKKDKPAGCNHFFGYLGTLPKDTETPDECYSCARLIECFK